MSPNDESKRLDFETLVAIERRDYKKALDCARNRALTSPSLEAAKGLDAIEGFLRTVTLDPSKPGPNSGDSFYRLGNELYESGLFEKAIACYEMVLAFDPTYYKALYNMGLAWACLEDYDKCIECMDRVHELQPGFAESLYVRGLAREYSDELALAIVEYGLALSENPGFKDALNRIPLCLVKLEKAASPGKGPLPAESAPALPQAIAPDGRTVLAASLRDITFAFTGPDQKEFVMRETPLRHVSLGEVVLSPKVRKTVERLIRVLKNPERARKYDIKRPLGLLLAGHPGTGKTLCAHAIACALRYNIVRIDMKSIGSMWANNTERNLTHCYDKIRDDHLYPAVILNDEFDSMGSSRVQEHGSSYELSRGGAVIQNFDRLINGDLAGLDLLVVATTNHWSSIDDALVRSGRLGTVVFELPDERMRLELFGIYFRKVPGTFDFERLAKLSDGKTGADIAAFADEAKMRLFDQDDDSGVRPTLSTLDVADIIRAHVDAGFKGYA